MPKVNPCAQKNEILVHKGHKHDYNSKLYERNIICFPAWRSTTKLLLNVTKFYSLLWFKRCRYLSLLSCYRVRHFPALLFHSALFFGLPIFQVLQIQQCTPPPPWNVLRFNVLQCSPIVLQYFYIMHQLRRLQFTMSWYSAIQPQVC